MARDYHDLLLGEKYQGERIESLEALVAAQGNSLSKESRRLLDAKALLETLLNRAYMRMDYHEADEIADFLGVKRPTDHELEDLR